MEFGLTLARLRRSRGWSQEALALRAGLSQRHISFLETGRASAGPKSLRRLIGALALRGWEQRSLFETFVPAARQSVAPRPDGAVIERLTDYFSPWPAYAFRPDGTLVRANLAMTRLLQRAAPNENLWQATASESGPNIYDLAFHPSGLVRWMQNPEEVITETLRRLWVEAAQDQTLAPIVERIESYPATKKFGIAKTLPPPVLIERYRLQGETISIISVVSHLASPGERELDLLRIESFVPADEQSELLLTRE